VTLRLQIATALGLLAAVAAVTAAFFSYTSVERQLRSETDSFLDDRIDQVLTFSAARAQLVEGGLAQPTTFDPTVVAPFIRYDAEMRFFLEDGSFVFAVSDVVLPVSQAEIDQAVASTEPIVSRSQVDGRTYELRLVSFDAETGQRAVLQIASDITSQVETLERLRLRLLALVATVVAAAGAVGYFLAGRLVHPLNSLRAATRTIADTKDFSQSVPVEGTGEISDVATDFNLMLGALDESMMQQRQLVQDAGHELRTPLSTLRASVELSQRVASQRVAAGGELADPDTDEVALLATAVGEVEELSRLVNELVGLASFSFDETPVENLDLGDVVTTAVQAFRLKQPQRTLEVDVGHNLPVRGKHEHLVRAVANVLANANKFAPDETTIDVMVAANRITVSDRGPGIPADEVDRIFDKFYRSPSVQNIDGSGLGLAFVAEVVRSHHGTVRAANRAGGGAVITLDIPASP